MKTVPPIVCLAAVLACGCGSSSGSSSSRSGSTAQRGSSGASGSDGQASTPAATLKLTTRPKYAAPSRSQPVRSGTVQIAYRDLAVHPDTIRVKLGSTVKWTNYDPFPANVTSEGGPQSFASKDFGEGSSFQVTLTKPGLIHFESTSHPASENGTIEVVS